MRVGQILGALEPFQGVMRQHHTPSYRPCPKTKGAARGPLLRIVFSVCRSTGQVGRAGEEFVYGAGGLAAFADGPDDQ